MLQSGLTVEEVGKHAGGFLSLGTEKQRAIVSMHVCASACVHTFGGNIWWKRESKRKGFTKDDKIKETPICGTTRKGLKYSH